MRWAKLQGMLHENCENLPDTFKNSSLYINTDIDTMGANDVKDRRGRTESPGSVRPHRRPHSLGSIRSQGVCFSGDGDAGNQTRGGQWGGDDSCITSSGRDYRKGKEERERSNHAYNSRVIPVDHLRGVLSDVGVQLGSDDASRLDNLVKREVDSSLSPKDRDREVMFTLT
jgi:hypothetical protein